MQSARGYFRFPEFALQSEQAAVSMNQEERKTRKKKTRLLSVIKEKLMVDLSFPLA